LALGLKPANCRIIPSENFKLSCITVWWKVVRMGLKSRHLRSLKKRVALCSSFHLPTYFQGTKFNFSRTILPSQATFAECKHVASLAFKSGAVLLRTFVRLNSNTNDVLVEQVELTVKFRSIREYVSVFQPLCCSGTFLKCLRCSWNPMYLSNFLS